MEALDKKLGEKDKIDDKADDNEDYANLGSSDSDNEKISESKQDSDDEIDFLTNKTSNTTASSSNVRKVDKKKFKTKHDKTRKAEKSVIVFNVHGNYFFHQSSLKLSLTFKFLSVCYRKISINKSFA